MKRIIDEYFPFIALIVAMIAVLCIAIYIINKKYEMANRLIDYAIENKIPIEVK